LFGSACAVFSPGARAADVSPGAQAADVSPGAQAAAVSPGAQAAAVSPGAQAADVPISEEARTHFAAGVALLQDPKAPRYEEAYREFRAAYAASPSYKILGNLGLCAMKIERDDEAIRAYETYLAEAGPEVSGQERQQIERDLLTLKAGVVRVTVSSNPPGATLVDVRTPVQGPEIRNIYGELSHPTAVGLRRGHHTLTARLAGYSDQTWEIDTADAPSAPHVFVMIAPSAPGPTYVRGRPIPAAAWVTGGLALALGAGSAFVGVFAIAEHHQYENDNGTNEKAARNDRATGMTLDTVADGLLIGAVVSAGVATYFVLTRPAVERPLKASARPSLWPVHVAPTWQPKVGPGVAAAWLF
jgi:hypothetical protein